MFLFLPPRTIIGTQVTDDVANINTITFIIPSDKSNDISGNLGKEKDDFVELDLDLDFEWFIWSLNFYKSKY